MSHILNEMYLEGLGESRSEWLANVNEETGHDYTEEDVMKDEEGEYVMVRNEMGGYTFLYLPEEGQIGTATTTSR